MLAKDQIHALNSLLTDVILAGHVTSEISLNKNREFSNVLRKFSFFLLHNFLVQHIKFLSYLLLFHHLCIGC